MLLTSVSLPPLPPHCHKPLRNTFDALPPGRAPPDTPPNTKRVLYIWGVRREALLGVQKKKAQHRLNREKKKRKSNLIGLSPLNMPIHPFFTKPIHSTTVVMPFPLGSRAIHPHKIHQHTHNTHTRIWTRAILSCKNIVVGQDSGHDGEACVL